MASRRLSVGCRRFLILQLIDRRDIDLLAGRHDLVQRRHRVPRADFAGVLLVVVEILGPQHAVLVADEPVAGDLGRVELDLDLHVLGDRHQRAGHLLDEHAAGLGAVIDVVVVAVAVVGDRFHHRVVEVAAAEAEHGEEHAGVLGLLSRPAVASSAVLVTPTLKSPSVQRMTRLVPPLMKLSSAIW